MWRSIAGGARRCAVSLRRSAGDLVPQVHGRVVVSRNNFNFLYSQTYSKLWLSSSAFESADDENGLSSSEPIIGENFDEVGENPGSVSSEFDDNVVGKGEDDVVVKEEDFGEKNDEFGGDPVSGYSEFDDSVVDKDEEVVVVQEVDLEQLNSVLSLLQSSRNRDDSLSLDSTLDEMNLTSLSEEFVVRVLETPLVPGDKLIGFFKWAMKKGESFCCTSRTLEALVRAISEDAGQKNAYAVWDLIKEEGETGKNKGFLTTSMLNGLISLLSKFGNAEAALEVFDKFDEFGCAPDSDTYYFTIDALCRRSFYDGACSVVEKMIDSGKLPEGERVGKVISYLCKGDKTKEAHSVYLFAKEKGKLPPQSSINFLISSLSRKDETVRLGLEMLTIFSGKERKSAIKPFSWVIRGLCRIKDVGATKDLLSKMIEEGPPPGNSVFNSIINGLSKAGDMEEARDMVKLMESRGLKPDVFTYTVIMSGYVKGGEMEEACKVLGEAKEKHPKLSTVTYHTLVRGYCKLGEFDKAVKLLGEMREFGVEPNGDEYNKLIRSLCLKALDWETAEKLMEEMKEHGLHPNPATKALLRAVKEVEEDVEAGSGGGVGKEVVAV